MRKVFAVPALLICTILTIVIISIVATHVRNEQVIGHMRQAIDDGYVEYHLSQAVGSQVRKVCLQTPYMRKVDFARVSGERISKYRVAKEHVNKIWLFYEGSGSRVITIDKWRHYRFLDEVSKCVDGDVIRFKRLNGETFLYL